MIRVFQTELLSDFFLDVICTFVLTFFLFPPRFSGVEVKISGNHLIEVNYIFQNIISNQLH
jgi:hypothetical protein